MIITVDDALPILKRTLFIFLPLFLLSLGMMLLFYLIELEKQETLAKNYALNHLNTLKTNIIKEWVIAVSDLLFLAQESTEWLEQSTYEQIKTSKSNYYQAFFRNRTLYDKIHLINFNRNESIQIGFNEDHSQIFSLLESSAEFQPSLFEEMKHLSEGELSISSTSFKKEQHHKHVLIIHLGQSIFNTQGKQVGAIVLDYLGQRILSSFDEILTDDPGNTMLLDTEGALLRGIHPFTLKKQYINDKREHKFQDDFTSAWQPIKSQNFGQFTHSNGLFTFVTLSSESLEQYLPVHEKITKIHFSSDMPWKIISYISTEVLQSQSRSFLEKLVMIFFFFIVLIAVGSFFLSVINHRRTLAERYLKEQFISYARFVPQEFLILLNRENFTEIEVSDSIQREVTIFFSDIRSYTHLSETMSPTETFDFLNIYFGQVDPLIRKNRGFIDKFIGDAVMAIFPESSQDALSSVIEIKHQLARFNQKRHETGLDPIRIGVGVHCGEVTLGTVGTPQRMQTTVIGDVVNLASRIESLTKVFKIDIILSDSVYKALPHPRKFNLREIDTVRVKGKQQPVVLYEVFDVDSQETIEGKRKSLPLFQEALNCYKTRCFDKAIDLFERCQEICPEDSLPPVYIKRCNTLQRIPPGPEWSGVSTL